MIWNNVTKSCSCPSDKPYLSRNNSCVSCNTLWNDTNFECVNCTLNNTVWNNVTKSCSCPSDKPYLNSNNICVYCPS